MSSRINLWGQEVRGAQKKATPVPYAERTSGPQKKLAEATTPASPRPAAPRPTPHRPAISTPSTQTVEDVTTHTVASNDVEAGAWENRQMLPVPHTGDRRLRSQRKRLVSPDKARRNPMCFTVSDEEAAILRAYAATLDMTFSEWVRKTLFKAANKKIPSRSRGGSAVDGD